MAKSHELPQEGRGRGVGKWVQVTTQPLARGWEKGRDKSVTHGSTEHQLQCQVTKAQISPRREDPETPKGQELGLSHRQARAEPRFEVLACLRPCGFGPGAQGTSKGQLTCVLWLRLPADFLEQRGDQGH